MQKSKLRRLHQNRGDMARTGKFGERNGETFFPISPFMIFPEAYGEFAVYLRKGRNYLLFTRQGELFGEKHKATLHENGITEVYIQLSQKPIYDEYLEDNLAKILLDGSIPLPVRASVLYYLATMVLDSLFEGGKSFLDPAAFDKLQNIVRASLGFFAGESALRGLSGSISREYTLCTHSANVFIYALAIFETFRGSEEEQFQLGLGAALHDIGKACIPKIILTKRGKLNTEEREQMRMHPVKGVGLCSLVPLGQTAIHSILFHHERSDGSGYPVGLTESRMPMGAKIVGVADAFDALTSRRAYAEALPPDRALAIMADHMIGCYDMEIMERFTALLGAAGVV